MKFIYSLRPTSSLIHDLFIYFIFKFFLTDPWSLISRSSILDPDFPVNLEVLLIKIILFFFYHWSDQLFQNQRFQAIEFLDQPVPEKLNMGFLLTMVMKCCKYSVRLVKFKVTRINTSVTR